MKQCLDCKTFKKADNCIKCKIDIKVQLCEIQEKLSKIKEMLMSRNSANVVQDIIDSNLCDFKGEIYGNIREK